MKIIVDTAGCDNPEKLVAGVIEAAKLHSDYTVVLVGDRAFLEAQPNIDTSNVVIEHAPDVITNDDVPTQAIKHKTESSLVRAISLLNGSEEAIGLLSGGSTGALLTGATLLVGRLRGVHRPVLVSPPMPTLVPGKLVCVADTGANVDSKPEFLAQFGVMGSLYMQAALGLENPAVGLLSVGTEEKKGDERTRAAHQLLKTAPINFVGNIEARDALTGDYDVIVSDGFSGNVLVKSIEGTAKMMMKLLKKSLTSSFKAKMGALLLKKSIYELKNTMDYHAYGGAAFLGVKKIVIKTHGSTNEVSARASIERIISLHENHIIEKIQDGISATVETEAEAQGE